MMPTIEEALQHLAIDYADDYILGNVKRMLNAAIQTLYGSVGEDIEEYMPDDPRAKELVLIYLDDLYNERGLQNKVAASTRRMVSDMEWQLRLELRQLREAAQA